MIALWSPRPSSPPLGWSRCPPEEVRCARSIRRHPDVGSTMVYTDVLNRGPAGVRTPADRMFTL
jgi:hypothetical protein